MDFPNWNGYEELIDTFSFREKASIKIPKFARYKAFSMQIDVEILSTDGNDYINSKSIPAYGFYGYVVLVMRDFAEIQIAINQPRQTIYYERREDAFANWYALYLKAIDSFEKAFVSEFQLTPIAEALGLTATTPSPECPVFSGFEEVRIREVYVKCRFGTRFKIEISRWQPVPVVYGESCAYDGNSRQVDGSKDDGLPSDGVQSTNNDNPSSPYTGYPPPSEEMELGDWSNSSKLGSIDSPNPNNEPLPVKRWAFVQGQYKDHAQNCRTLYFGVTFEISLEDESLTPYVSPPFPISDLCGGQLVIAELRGGDTGVVYTSVGGDGTYITEITDAIENPYTGYSPTPNKP